MNESCGTDFRKFSTLVPRFRQSGDSSYEDSLLKSAMTWLRSDNIFRLIRLLVFVLIVKVTVTVVMVYRNYLPPNFDSEFLLGRDSYFFGSYGIAFYFHILAGPITLLLGIVLLSKRFRLKFRMWHRRLGQIQIAIVVVLSISGLWMSRYAQGGTVAAIGFGSLSFATGISAFVGFRSAMKRRFHEHRRWMMRNYILLCSAVVLRLTAGVAVFFEVDAEWVYPMTSWTSWLVPLALYELHIRWTAPAWQRLVARETQLTLSKNGPES